MANNWPLVPLSEVLTERQEIPSPADLESGAIRIVSKIGFNDGRIQLRDGGETKTGMILIRPGDLVISGINALKGAIAMYDKTATAPIAATIHYGAYITNDERVDMRFLWWLLRSETFREILLQYLPGGIKSELKAKRFLPVPVPLPPVPEQQRIVARIEELARRVEEARGLRREAVGEAELLSGRAIASIFEGAESEAWMALTLGDIITDIRYGTSEKANDDQPGIPVLRIGNIQDGKLSLRDLKYLDLSKDEFERLRLKHGDILVNRTNSAELVGKCAVFGEPGDFVYASYIIRVRLDLQKAEPRLVSAFINSPIGRQYMFEQRKQMTGQANVNSQKLKALPLSLPPLAEQRRIVAYLDGLQAKVDDLRRLQAETQRELDALMPSILAKAFAGEL